MLCVQRGVVTSLERTHARTKRTQPRLALAAAASARPANAIDGDRSSAKEDQRKRNRSERQRELVSSLAEQTMGQMDLEDGHQHVNANCERSNAREQPKQHENSAEELGSRHDVGEPRRDVHAGKEAGEGMHMAIYFFVAMTDHHGTQCQAQNEKSDGLYPIQIVQQSLQKTTNVKDGGP